MGDPAIAVEGLTKRFGEVLAVDDVSFTVDRGEVFGFLGPNGAGKTTTIDTLLGLLHPTAGTAHVLGADVRDATALTAARERVGYLPANPGFDEEATGREILELFDGLRGNTRVEELLELFDPPLDRAVRGYSSGNRQMLGIVLAFAHDPDLVVLDEPTSGLDPLKQERFNEFLRAERDRGTTVFFSSHVLSEVRQVCDRVGILRDGRLVTVETMADLLGRSGKVVRARVADEVTAAAVDLPGAHDVTVRPAADIPEVGSGTALRFTYTGDPNALVDRLDGLDLVDLDVEEAPLEDVFRRFYGGDGEALDGDRAAEEPVSSATPSPGDGAGTGGDGGA